MNAAEDFLLLIVHSHIIAAARVLIPYVDRLHCFIGQVSYSLICAAIYMPTEKPSESVHAYAKEVLTLGLIWWYCAIKEGDGNHVLRYWKFLLVIFNRGVGRGGALGARAPPPCLTEDLKICSS